jgi:hypothetical protein|tara:strand:- start:147 stop:713 length:567 start_codon:yes stop_codon:yes gene_type:complete
MSYYFSSFPKVSYDIKKNNHPQNVTNIMLRYKLTKALKERPLSYYNYTVEDGQRPDNVAFDLYGISTYSWILLLVNSIHDPNYEWPLAQRSFEKFLKVKYGSIPAALSTVHEYRKVVNEQSVLFDNTIIPKRTLVVDETTYNTLSTGAREIIYKSDYEEELNDERRNILYIPLTILPTLLGDISEIFE